MGSRVSKRETHVFSYSSFCKGGARVAGGGFSGLATRCLKIPRFRFAQPLPLRKGEKKKDSHTHFSYSSFFYKGGTESI